MQPITHSNDAMYALLASLVDLNNPNMNKFLFRVDDRIELNIDSRLLFSVSRAASSFAGEDMSKTIQPKTKIATIKEIDTIDIQDFLHAIKESIIRLNHIGIGYKCLDTDQEIIKLERLLKGTGFKLYEEPTHLKKKRWLFIGDTSDWRSPLFEVVLNECQDTTVTDWFPHFHIDFDTDLSAKELEELAREYLASNFFTFKLDIKDIGLVLLMGRLSRVDTVNFYLGCGTSLRETKWQRLESLKEYHTDKTFE